MSNEKTHYMQRNDSGETVGKENKLKILIALNPLCSLYRSLH